MNIEFESNCTERLIEAENVHRQAISATVAIEEEKLILYHFVGCPFCSIARSPKLMMHLVGLKKAAMA
jgi:hypothetical protein